MRRALMIALAAVLIAMAVLPLVGCDKTAETPTVTPKIAPPVIAEAGVLRVGLDLTYPPFAGTDGGREAGLDYDVAAALADRLGLSLDITDIGTDGYPAALADGSIDIALAAIPISEAVLADVAFAGSYVNDATAIFGSAPSTMTVGDLPGTRVAVQESSMSFWELESTFGEGFSVPYETLRAAFEALVAGEVDYVVADAIVGAYIARDFDGVVYVGQMTPAQPLGVAVAKDKPELETAIRESLDELAAEGVLETIRSKWATGLPSLEATLPAGS